MGFYNQVILPRLIEFAMRQKYLELFRQHAEAEHEAGFRR